ncbi:hypothetical protein LJC49_09495 [Ruminococcaceae bacterium OttesenSCG-928-I18]|nr:hypothetical protein [Ruminococcaceae bacterium OttesenSCG-928-I18]
MKRQLSWMLILVLVLCLAACDGPVESTPPAVESEALQSAGQPAADEAPASTSTEEAMSPEAHASAEVPTGNFESWNALFTEYNNCIMNDTEAFTSDPDVGIAALTLLAGEIELSYTNVFFQPDAESGTSMVLEMLSMTDVSYTEQGDTASAEAVNSSGLLEKYEVRYGGGNTAVMFYYVDGALQFELSLCVTDDYSAKMYKEYDDDSPETICAIVKPNGDVWMGIDTQILEGTLYQNGAAAEDAGFTEGLPEHFSYIDGVLTKS